MKTLGCIALAVIGMLGSGCAPNPKSGRRFQLPQGNAENGRAAFIALQCTACHSISGVKLPEPTAAPGDVVVLGGEVVRMRTYGDLLTSIIHPNQRISEKMKRSVAALPGKSPMPAVNDRMTVTQMIDLVAFLQPHYHELPLPAKWYYPL